MYKYFLPILFFLGYTVNEIRSQEAPLLFCGVGSHQLTDFQHEWRANKDYYTSLRSNNDLLILPLTIHIIGQSDGSGYYSLPDLMVTLCELNRNFAPFNVQFYIKDNIRYHNNTVWYNHQTQAIGSTMASITAVSGTINIWIANGAGGAAGYATLGGNRIWLAKNQIRGVGNTTLTHEMGHSLALPHTFNGWENRTYQQGTTAPAFIFFGDRNIPTERVDRSNCTVAADGFCDTEPDYLSDRWNCNPQGMSPIELTDPMGEKFRANGRNYMSYSNDACTAQFSEEQISFMRAHILARKANLIFSGTLPDPVTGPMSVVFPRQEDEPHFENIRFSWRRQSNASAYRVQIARTASLGLIEADEIVTDTFFVLNAPLLTTRNYFWRVTPISSTDFCASPSEIITFRPVQSTSTVDLAGNSFSVFPTLLTDQQNTLTLQGRLMASLQTRIEVIDLTGRVIHQRQLFLLPGEFRESIELRNLTKGMYILKIDTPTGYHTYKLTAQ